MAISLVRYFNSLPLKLPSRKHSAAYPGSTRCDPDVRLSEYRRHRESDPEKHASPAAGTTTLQQLLLAIPLPTTPGSDYQIYQAAAASRHRRVASTAHRRPHASLQWQNAGECAGTGKPARRELQFQFQQRVFFERLVDVHERLIFHVDCVIHFRQTVLGLRRRLRARPEPGIAEDSFPSLPKRYRGNNP